MPPHDTAILPGPPRNSPTEGAISRQIARLESLLNCKLFDRTGSRVKLNPAGARYARHVHETLERLERDTQYIMGLPEGAKVWILPSCRPFPADG
jgi:DNA-binding transcriptional LysR family regulator